MITAEEARKRVEEHNSCAVLHLDSDDKDVNAKHICEVADEAIRQSSSDGISHMHEAAVAYGLEILYEE